MVNKQVQHIAYVSEDLMYPTKFLLFITMIQVTIIILSLTH